MTTILFIFTLIRLHCSLPSYVTSRVLLMFLSSAFKELLFCIIVSETNVRSEARVYSNNSTRVDTTKRAVDHSAARQRSAICCRFTGDISFQWRERLSVVCQLKTLYGVKPTQLYNIMRHEFSRHAEIHGDRSTGFISSK